MALYQKCDEGTRPKVGGRFVYEGSQADGEGKVYCWYNSAWKKWHFSNRKKHIGTSTCGFYALSSAASPELIDPSSTWMAYVTGKWEEVAGGVIEVRSLTAEQLRLEQEQVCCVGPYRPAMVPVWLCSFRP